MNFALHIIKTCVNQGVSHFCFAPGSRSTPLIVALAKTEGVQVHTHFDERGLAFFALGLAKKEEKPVAVITTSGTAVGNLLPAVMEASASHIPLILLTADRPFELRACGANQTIDQVKLFSPFVRKELDLPATGTDARAIEHAVAHAIFEAVHTLSGPVHINCPFEEPFLPLSERPSCAPIRFAPTSATPSQKTLQEWASALKSIDEGVIVVGEGAFSKESPALHTLASTLQWPLFADPLSGVRSLADNVVAHANLELPYAPKAILHLGARLVSTNILKWMDQSAPALYAHISKYSTRTDPLHRVTHRMTADPALLCQELAARIRKKEPTAWIKQWRALSDELHQRVQKQFSQNSALTEEGLTYFLSERLPSHLSLFVGNSMPIRHVDTLFFPKKPLQLLTANRGVSGIDGCIATACGLSDIALIGDLAALHDINSLALMKKRERPLLLIVINNHGGAIFNHLPIAQEAPEILATHFVHAHPYTFKGAAALFHIPYESFTSKRLLEKRLLELFKEPATCLIEVGTG